MKKIAIIVASLAFVAVGCKNVPEEQAFEDYKASVESFMANYNEEAQKIMDDAVATEEEKDAKMEALYEKSVESLIKDGKKVIKKYPSGDLAIAALQNIANYMEPAELQETLSMLKDAASENEYVVSLTKSIAAKEATAEGKMFTDFTIVQDPENPEETTVKFSDYIGKGKYMIVDFWSWWCGPCIREVPNLINVYNEFHGEDFDMLSVSVWERGEPWKSAEKAEELGICWNEIINGDSIPTDIYGIEGIPHIILFGPDGTILKRDLRGEEIGKAVAEALGR